MYASEKMKHIHVKDDDLALITYHLNEKIVYSGVYKITFEGGANIKGVLIHQLQHAPYRKEKCGFEKTWIMLDGDYDIKKIKKEEHPEYFV
jgi:hypothetical protein